MRTLELLAPARDLECGKAAIDHGADAVYIGAARFGARAAAGNSAGDIAELCRYAHGYGARVYVTVNTIVYDDELEATRQLLLQLDEAGADAVLVQDMAVLDMVRGGRMAAHASTQTDNRTAAKVRWLRDVGFSRVVLARELSAQEVAGIHAEVPDVELEVFVHGALCVSYSGQCYASQYCFGRSANRGECAQFCRLKFDLVDADGRAIERGRYFLSLKDMCRLDGLEALVDAGTTSFKIEGRLKDVAYVKNVTAAYSLRLNEIIRRHPGQYRRASFGRCAYAFTPDLRKTFNRGYTQYFLDGRCTDMASMDTPKAKGEFVGRVKELRGASFTVAGLATFANGDGLCFVGSDGRLEGFRVNRVQNNRLFPQRMPSGLLAGTALYRNNDQEFERQLSRQSSVRKIPVGLKLEMTDAGLALTAQVDGGPVVRVEAPLELQKAEHDQRGNVVKQLSKLGTTVYECSGVELPEGFDSFVPSSVLAKLRRSVVEALDDAMLKSMVTPCKWEPNGKAMPPKCGPYGYLYNVSNVEARAFYAAHGIHDVAAAYELRPVAGALLMQCRHCIRHSLGLCTKHAARRPEWPEPWYLALPDGRRFRLEFDCRRCQMNVYAPEGGKANKNRQADGGS